MPDPNPNPNPRRDGGPAFPRDWKWNVDSSVEQRGATGMTLRAWLAGQALAGIMANPGCGRMAPETVARQAAGRADTPVEALDET